jgi:hypothetical protein
MRTKLLKRLVMGAVLVFAVAFLLDRPLISQGIDPEEESLIAKRPYNAQEGDSVPPLQTIGVGVYVISFDELNLALRLFILAKKQDS